YPSIKVLLQIFATIPITKATVEISFSSLRRLKKYIFDLPCPKIG
ncbi:52 kDa repressor of the inhibitor of the protein kinase-like, partial [Aphis craccivora]